MESVLLKYIQGFIKNRLSGHTWRHICFGIPGNQEEFLHEIKTREIPGLDISMGMASRNYYSGGLELQEYFPILQADRRKLELKDLSRQCTSLNSHKMNLERLCVQIGVFDTMVELASDFKRRGFRATINGKSIEEEEKRFEEYILAQRASLGDRI